MAKKKITKKPVNPPANVTAEERITAFVRSTRQQGDTSAAILVRKWKHPQYIAIGPRFGCGLLFEGPYATPEELDRRLPEIAAIVERAK